MAINMNSTLAEVREEILKNKVISEQNQEIINKLVKQIEAYRSSINPDSVEKLRHYGIYLDNLMNADLEKLSTDKVYLQEFIEYLRNTIQEFKKVVVTILND